jgi:hypothetical protein
MLQRFIQNKEQHYVTGGTRQRTVTSETTPKCRHDVFLWIAEKVRNKNILDIVQFRSNHGLRFFLHVFNLKPDWFLMHPINEA